jgi:hypothetical protein
MNDKYDIGEGMFRVLFRKLYEDVEISNEVIDKFRIEFIKYLRSLKLSERQEDNVLPKSEAEIVLNQEHPLKMFGFPSAYVYHFAEFVEKVYKLNSETEDNGE